MRAQLHKKYRRTNLLAGWLKMYLLTMLPLNPCWCAFYFVFVPFNCLKKKSGKELEGLKLSFRDLILSKRTELKHFLCFAWFLCKIIVFWWQIYCFKLISREILGTLLIWIEKNMNDEYSLYWLCVVLLPMNVLPIIALKFALLHM